MIEYAQGHDRQLRELGEQPVHFVIDQMPINLASGTPLALADSKGTSLRVLSGRIWVTEEDPLDDVFLDEGQTHTLRAGGRTVITSEGHPSASVIFNTTLQVSSRTRLPFAW